MSLHNASESVGRHTLQIDELGRISYATIAAVPEPGVLIVQQRGGTLGALKRVEDGGGARYDTCLWEWARGEWILEVWWPEKSHLHCIEQ